MYTNPTCSHGKGGRYQLWPVNSLWIVRTQSRRLKRMTHVACSIACLRTTGNFALLIMRLELHRASLAAMDENLAFNGPITYNTNHDTQYNLKENADHKRYVYKMISIKNSIWFKIIATLYIFTSKDCSRWVMCEGNPTKTISSAWAFSMTGTLICESWLSIPSKTRRSRPQLGTKTAEPVCKNFPVHIYACDLT